MLEVGLGREWLSTGSVIPTRHNSGFLKSLNDSDFWGLVQEGVKDFRGNDCIFIYLEEGGLESEREKIRK